MNPPSVMTVTVRGANDWAAGISDAVITAAGRKRTVEYVVEHGVAEMQFCGLSIAGYRKSQGCEGGEF
jgi:hypothetical protein